MATDGNGAFTWHFGTACTGVDAALAAERANAYLNRVDPNRVGFSARPMQYWAEYWDSGLRTSNVVDYQLSYDGTCTPNCAGKDCGSDGCGGTCGLCGDGTSCQSGTCTDYGPPKSTACGTYSSSDIHWTLANSPVQVTCDVVITRKLTIDPGVVVLFMHPEDDLRIGSGGNLVAVGTADAPIIFSSNTGNTPGSWGGIDIYSSGGRATIRDVEVRYAGSILSDAKFPIRLNASGWLVGGRIMLGENRIDAIGVVTGTYATDIDFNVPGVPYWVEGDIVLDDYDGTFTIQPGVVVKFAGVGTDIILSDGNLSARGTYENPIVLTSSQDDSRLGDSNRDGEATSPAQGDWGGIYFGYSTGGSIDNVLMKFGGNVGASAAGFPIRVSPRTQPSINNVTLVQNVHEAIGVDTGTYICVRITHISS